MEYERALCARVVSEDNFVLLTRSTRNVKMHSGRTGRSPLFVRAEAWLGFSFSAKSWPLAIRLAADWGNSSTVCIRMMSRKDLTGVDGSSAVSTMMSRFGGAGRAASVLL